MACKSIIYTGIITIIIYGHVSGQSISVQPQDQTVQVGDRVTVQCEADVAHIALFWVREVHNTQGPEELFLYYQDHVSKPVDAEKYEIEGGMHLDGVYNLVIKSVGIWDAGRYTCKLTPEPPGTSATMNLIVVEKPSITSSAKIIAGSSVELACEASFGAPRKDQINSEHKPFIQGYLQDKLLSNAVSKVEDGIPGQTLWKAVYRCNRTVTAENDKQKFQCELRSEIPFFALMSSQALDVQYKVSTIEVNPIKQVYNPGDVINCTANGNPEPSYTWRALKSSGARPVNSPQLDVNTNMLGYNQWQCRAENQPVGSSLPESVLKTIEFDVEETVTKKPETPKAAGLNIAIIVVICVVIIVIIVGAGIGFYFIRRKKRYNPKSAAKAVNVAESDVGDTGDEDESGLKDTEAGTKLRPGMSEQNKMLPVIKDRVKFSNENGELEELPLRRPVMEYEPPVRRQMENVNTSQPPVRESDRPPTPPPPLEEDDLAPRDTDNQNRNEANKHGPPVKPKPKKSNKPGNKPVPRARSRENLADGPRPGGSRENLADRSAGSRENLSDAKATMV